MQTTLEQCPLCGSDLSQAKFREIRAKMKDDDQKRAEALAEAKLAITRGVETELKREFERQRLLADKKIKEEADQRVGKIRGESELLAKQLLEAQQREAATREKARLEVAQHKQAAEKKAKADTEQEMRKIAAERDLATKQLKESQQREAQVRKQTEEEAKKQWQKQLTEQRQALEKDKNVALMKQNSENARGRESLQKQVKILELKLQNKTANELGDGGEIDVFEALRDAFPDDRITRIQKGQPGADTLHEILYKGEVCGRIVTDSKNRQGWQNVFVSKLRQDQVAANAEHAILATTIFPSGKKEMCIESGVIVIAPAHVVHVVQILRQAMVTMHIKGLSMNERSTKMSQLYALITSEAYCAKFAEANRLTLDVLELDVKEQAEHTRVWRNRGTLAKRLQKILREVETDVAAVIESAGDVDGAPPVFDKPLAAKSAAS